MYSTQQKTRLFVLVILLSFIIGDEITQAQTREYVVPAKNFKNFAPSLTQEQDREKWLRDNEAKLIEFTGDGFWQPEGQYYVVYRYRSFGLWFGPGDSPAWQEKALEDLKALKEKLSRAIDRRIREASIDVRVFKVTISPGDSVKYGFDDGETSNGLVNDYSTTFGGLKSKTDKKTTSKFTSEGENINTGPESKETDLGNEPVSNPYPSVAIENTVVASIPKPEKFAPEKRRITKPSSEGMKEKTSQVGNLAPMKIEKDRKDSSNYFSERNKGESSESMGHISPSSSDTLSNAKSIYTAFLDVRRLHGVISPTKAISGNGEYFRYLYIKKAFVRDNGESSTIRPPEADIGLIVYGGPTFKDILNKDIVANTDGVRLYGPIYTDLDEDRITHKFEWDDYCTVYYNNFCIVDLTNYGYEYIRLVAMEGDHEHDWSDGETNVGKIAFSPAGTSTIGATVGGLLGGPVGSFLGAAVGYFTAKGAGVHDIFRNDCVFDAKVSLSDLATTDEIVVKGNCDIPGQCAELTLKLVTPSMEEKTQPGLFWNRIGLHQHGVKIFYSDQRVIVKNLTGRDINVFACVYTDYADGRQGWTDWLGPFQISFDQTKGTPLLGSEGWEVAGYWLGIYAESTDGAYVWNAYKKDALNIASERPMEKRTDYIVPPFGK